MNPKTLETIQTIHPTSKTLYSLNHWYSKYMKTAKNKSTKIKVLKTGFPTSFRESLGNPSGVGFYGFGPNKSHLSETQ